MLRYFILHTGFAERILKEKSLKISWNYMRGQQKTDELKVIEDTWLSNMVETHFMCYFY